MKIEQQKYQHQNMIYELLALRSGVTDDSSNFEKVFQELVVENNDDVTLLALRYKFFCRENVGKE